MKPVEDRKRLEQLVGYPVRGMAYTFGNTNEFVIDAITGLGIEYARTVGDTYNFSIPADLPEVANLPFIYLEKQITNPMMMKTTKRNSLFLPSYKRFQE